LGITVQQAAEKLLKVWLFWPTGDRRGRTT